GRNTTASNAASTGADESFSLCGILRRVLCGCLRRFRNFANLVMRARPHLVLGKAVGNLEPRRFGADEKVSFGAVRRRLVEPAQREADLFGIVVVGADEVRAADAAEMLDDELGGMEAREQI